MNVYVNTVRSGILIYSGKEEEGLSIARLLEKDFPVTTLLDTKELPEEILKVPPGLIIISSCMLKNLKLFCREEFESVPVIAFMEAYDEDKMKHAMEAGVDDFIFSPIKPLELSTRIRSLLHLSCSQKKILEQSSENLKLLLFQEDILRILVHDMGNSVSGIVGSLDLLKLQSKNFTDKQNKNLNRVNESAKELLQIIKNIADVLQGTDKYKYRPEPVDLCRIVKDLKVSMEAFFYYNKRELIIAIPEDSIKVKGNEELVKRVMENLLGNAIKNTPALSKVFITLEKLKDPSCVKISVRDEGKALPGDYRKKIFNLYGQLEIFDAGYRVGRGFSMSFCHLAVNRLGGKIWMEDLEKEKGNTFCITLPLMEL